MALRGSTKVRESQCVNEREGACAATIRHMLIAELSHLSPHLHIADVGAAFIGEIPPYQGLLDAGLGRLTAFEPDEREAARLAQKLGDNARLLPYALGDGEQHTLRVCGNGLGMTSLLEPDPATLDYFNLFTEWGRVESRIPCPTHRLDDLPEVEPIDYLKMDVQGSELMILSHGREKLARCVAVQSEVSFITLYQDQPTFADIDRELRGQGLIPHRFTNVKTWSIRPTTAGGNARVPFHQLLEADIVYIRDIIHPETVSDEQLAKLAIIAHFTYSSPDLTARCLEVLTERGSVEAGCRVRYYEWLASA